MGPRNGPKMKMSVQRAPISGLLLLGCGLATAVAAQTISPMADGTLADGGSYGPFDGVADIADWSFNQSSFEGAITLAGDLEHRLVFEFDLNGISAAPPVTARLSFALRGTTRFPAEAAHIEVHAYAADGLESPADFSAASVARVCTKSVQPFQPTTAYVVNVSESVNTALMAGGSKIGFRFQIATGTGTQTSQAFMDALDADVATKPALTIDHRFPSDLDSDGDLDPTDYSYLAGCLSNPGSRVATRCQVADVDLDQDVDMLDVASFFADFAVYGSE